MPFPLIIYRTVTTLMTVFQKMVNWDGHCDFNLTLLL